MRMTASNRREQKPGVAVLSGPIDQLEPILAALLSRGFKAAPEADLRNRASHGLPSHPTSAAADEAGAPNAGHTPGTKHPVTGRKYSPDAGVSFITVPMVEREGLDRSIDRIAASIDPRSGWRLRMHTAPSSHLVYDPSKDPDGQGAIARRELAQLRKELGLPPFMGGGSAENPAYTLQGGGGHPAELFRRAISSLLGPLGGGVEQGSLSITQNGSPNMSVNVAGGPDIGEIWIPGTSVPGQQGMYYCYNDATLNLAIVASDPTDPRVDTPIGQVEDGTYIGSANIWQVAILTGTPTPGATLGNLDGIASLPVSSLTVGYALVPAGAVAITTGDIAYALGVIRLSDGALNGVARHSGIDGPPLDEISDLDEPTVAATSFVPANGPLFVFGHTAVAVTGVTTGWYSDSGHTTPVSAGGAWVEYVTSGNGVYGNYYNPTSATLYPRSVVTAVGY